MADADAIVVGAGPNGLVAANNLADKGWDVLVLESTSQPGGAVRSGEIAAPGFTSDLFSAFYPLAATVAPIGKLGLEDFGLEWTRTEAAVAHVHGDGRSAYIGSLEETCESVEAFAPGDGDRWRELYELWLKAGPHMLGSLFTPFPPVRSGVGMANALRADLLRFVRFGLLPVRRMTEEWFRGEGAGWLIAGNALHADLTPDSAGGGLFGWVLCGLGQEVGFPFPRGGAGRVTDALVARLRARGGALTCDAHVEAIEVEGGTAKGVRCSDGRRFTASRAVLADVPAPRLYLDMLPEERVPARLREDMESFQFDNSTVKVDWALDGPIPWTSADARRAGTIHVADGMDDLTLSCGELFRNLVPADPFIILGQYSMADTTRAPEGCETAWGYTHVPQRAKGDARGELSGRWEEGEADAFADRMEERVERCAPGFRKLIRGRHVFAPPDLESANPSLVNGAINGGTAQIHQQLLFRPTPALGRPETPVRKLYLASASAHPGGGVHGGPGANAARAALGGVARRRAAAGLGAAASAAVLAGGLRGGRRLT